MILALNTEDRYKALVAALDQYTENMGEWAADEFGNDEEAIRAGCPELAAAQELLDELNFVRLKASGLAIESEESNRIASRRRQSIEECLGMPLETVDG